AGEAGGRREEREPGEPLAAWRAIHHTDERLGNEGVAPVCEAAFARVAVEFGVTFAQEAKGVLVEAHPNVEAVFLDAIGGAASGGALAAEAPTELIDGDVEFVVKFGTSEIEGGGDRSASAADNGNFDGLLTTHSFYTRLKCACVSEDADEDVLSSRIGQPRECQVGTTESK